LPDEWRQAVGESRRQAASQAKRLRRGRKSAQLIEEPSQKRARQRKLERTKAGGARGCDRRREPQSQPLVIRRCNGRRMADTHRRLSRRCKVRLKSKVHHKRVRGIERPKAARFKPQAQSTSVRRDSGSHESRVRELGSGASRKTNQDSAERLRERK